MWYLTRILSLYFPLGPEEAALSQITLINKGFRRRDYRDSACRNAGKHHKISFVLLCLQRRSEVNKDPGRVWRLHYVWATCCPGEPGYVFAEAVLYNSRRLPSSSRRGRVRGGERWLPARLCQHPRLLPLPVPGGIQAPCRRAHLHR